MAAVGAILMLPRLPSGSELGRERDDTVLLTAAKTTRAKLMPDVLPR